MGDPELPEPYGYSPFEGELYEPDQLDEEVKATAMQLFTVSQIQAFAEEAVRQERKACESIAISWSDKSYEAEQIAAEIRARSEQGGEG